MNWLKRHARPLLLVSLAAVSGFMCYMAVAEDRHGLLTVAFLDVGQGDAIYIEAPNGGQVVVDGGPGTALLPQLGSVMPFYDRTIDALLITNPDTDHFSGFIPALSRYRVGAIVDSGTQTVSAAFAALASLARETNVPVKILRAGDRIVLDKRRGVVLDVLFPDRDASGLDTNVGSLVARLSYGSVCFMLMGDAPRSVENYLVRLYGSALRCQVLKAGHHGSKTSSAPMFVQAVAPQFAVISVGKGNTYGHPNQETLDTLNANGVKILRTDQLGTITFKVDGMHIWQE